MANNLLKILSLFADLSDAEKHTLESVVSGETAYAEGETVYLDDERQHALYIVSRGWFHSYTILPNGSRQIHEIFTTGDIVGAKHLSWSRSTSCVAAASDGVLARVPVQQMQSVLMSNPRLNAIFYALQMTHSVMLLDRITAVARLGAYQRFSYFLADALTRQRRISGDHSSRLHLPLSQSFIADCLGLSSVHISRQVTKLVNAGIIAKNGRLELEVLDAPALFRLSDYKDRFLQIDRDGFATTFLDMDAVAQTQ